MSSSEERETNSFFLQHMSDEPSAIVLCGAHKHTSSELHTYQLCITLTRTSSVLYIFLHKLCTTHMLTQVLNFTHISSVLRSPTQLYSPQSLYYTYSHTSSVQHTYTSSELHTHQLCAPHITVPHTQALCSTHTHTLTLQLYFSVRTHSPAHTLPKTFLFHVQPRYHIRHTCTPHTQQEKRETLKPSE